MNPLTTCAASVSGQTGRKRATGWFNRLRNGWMACVLLALLLSGCSQPTPPPAPPKATAANAALSLPRGSARRCSTT